MDPLVVAAMARWPDVPAVHGWLRLDRRGDWWLVDRGAPGFDEAVHGAGSRITSPPILAFIARNHASDPDGRWYWQNGPQRVYVDCDPAPLVYRVFDPGDAAHLVTHTGVQACRFDAAWSDAAGALWVVTDAGPGLVHDLDAAALEAQPAPDGSMAALRLMGALRPVRPLPGEPGPTLGFVARPRA